MPGLGSTLSTCCPTKKVQMAVYSAHLCRTNSFPCVTWFQTKREAVYVKSGRFGVLNPVKLNVA